MFKIRLKSTKEKKKILIKHLLNGKSNTTFTTTNFTNSKSNFSLRNKRLTKHDHSVQSK